MKKTKIVLVTFEIEAKERYLADIKSFFEDFAEIEGYSIREKIEGSIRGDLVIISSPSATKYVRPHLDNESEIIYLTRTFVRESINKLYNLPAGTKAMLVDYSYETCNDIISILYEIGMKHLHFVPVYPSMEKKDIPVLDIAITPGLLTYVPPEAKEIIDIGWTVVDMSTIMEIATKLNIYNERIEEKLLLYSNRITTISRGLVYALKSSIEMKNQWGIILDVIDDGVIVIDSENTIIHCNKYVSKLLKINDKSLFGKKIDKVIPYESLFKKIITQNQFENLLLNIKEINRILVITKKHIFVNGHIYGSLFIFKDVTEIQNLESQLRRQLTDKGHIAKYYFKDICGSSKSIMACIEKAMKIAQIDATVLITGESGTGKELFAQSIHNASNRKNKPFIAINCAALPSTLLESELFGYEEGAFTNAKKKGKKGLFELAHTGTIFLDEIGDIPKSIQVKLLRVIQEKEIMRIGGSNIIPIDVRLIAATNQDLHRLTESGEFRKDLYYRINVLNLHLPALRDRKSDIPALIQDILKEIGYDNKKIDGNLLEVLMSSSWKGNVRELKGCIQHMAYLGADVITIDDLPPDFQSLYLNDHSLDNNFSEQKLFEELLPPERELAETVLNTMKHRSMGRRLIGNLLKSQGLEISEHEIRKILGYLLEKQYIVYGKGRSGARLTELGKAKVFQALNS